MRIDPEAVTTYYWRPLDENDALLATEISLDDGETWAEMTTGPNEAGDDANQWTFAGYGVEPARPGVDTYLPETPTRTWFLIRIAANPEIEAESFHIDCQRTYG